MFVYNVHETEGVVKWKWKTHFISSDFCRRKIVYLYIFPYCFPYRHELSSKAVHVLSGLTRLQSCSTQFRFIPSHHPVTNFPNQFCCGRKKANPGNIIIQYNLIFFSFNIERNKILSPPPQRELFSTWKPRKPQATTSNTKLSCMFYFSIPFCLTTTSLKVEVKARQGKEEDKKKVNYVRIKLKKKVERKESVEEFHLKRKRRALGKGMKPNRH